MPTIHIHRFAAVALAAASLGLAPPRAASCLGVTEAGAADTIELINPFRPVSQPPKLPSKAQAASANDPAAWPDPAGVELIPASDTPPTDLARDDCAECSPDGCCRCPQGHVDGPCQRLRHFWHTHMKPCLQASHWGYPEYFCERPFGSCNLQATQTMVANGLRDQMVLYEYDFGRGDDTSTLKDRGVVQLEKMIRRIPIAGCPVIIHTSGDTQLDAERRLHVLDTLAKLGMELEPEMVVVGRPGVRGLDGEEALPIYWNLLEQTRLRGNVGIETSALRDIGFGSNSTGSANGGSLNSAQ